MKSESSDGLTALLASLSREDYCYLTTTGRLSGRPHEIEIWFGVDGAALYLLSGGGEASDWVKNLTANPNVTIRIGKHTFSGTARRVKDEEEDLSARHLLAGKYQEWEAEETLSEGARTALPVANEFNPPRVE